MLHFFKVESQGQHILGAPTKDEGGLLQSQWTDILNTESSEKMQKVLDSSVDQIAGVSIFTFLNLEYHCQQINCV